MYATYQVDGPSRSTARATTFIKDENFFDDEEANKRLTRPMHNGWKL